MRQNKFALGCQKLYIGLNKPVQLLSFPSAKKIIIAAKFGKFSHPLKRSCQNGLIVQAQVEHEETKFWFFKTKHFPMTTLKDGPSFCHLEKSPEHFRDLFDYNVLY